MHLFGARFIYLYIFVFKLPQLASAHRTAPLSQSARGSESSSVKSLVSWEELN